MDLQPLSQQFAITDERGKPTLYFTQWAQQRLTDTNDALAGYAPLAGAAFTGPVSITGATLTLKASATSSGFTISDRATAPGHICDFVAQAPVSSAGASLVVYNANSTAVNKSTAQIALFNVSVTQPSTTKAAIQCVTGTSGEECNILTQQVGTGALTAGDIVFRPNLVEKLRVVALAGAPTQVKVTGQLSVTDEAYGASWSGSLNVPTKNAVYNKIQTISGGGGATTIGAPRGLLTISPVSGTLNFYLMLRVFADDNITISKVAFLCSSATPAAVYQPFIYNCTTGNVLGTLVQSGIAVTGSLNGYNEAPLSAPAALVKGNFYYIGVSVITATIANLFVFSTGTAAFAANGGSSVPATPGPAITNTGTLYGFWGVV